MIFGRRRRAEEDAVSAPDSIYHTSMILRIFCDRLERQPESHVLDVGPVCGDNISFLARRVTRLTICDMFFHLDQVRREGLSPGRIWSHLDYPPESFDGILLWDMPDRLENPELAGLVELCRTLLKSGGMVVIFSLSEEETPGVVDAFVVGEDFQFHQRRQPHLTLPMNRRQNRDMLALLTPFEPVKSFIHRTGLREFLFQSG
ncbi:MAG: class I SAM-dependent methyltransferase [Deltaproteobacteria bacterium]|nr:class I SAM-dependent methyltransferase [Deltaproteobacteria bacterium]